MLRAMPKSGRKSVAVRRHRRVDFVMNIPPPLSAVPSVQSSMPDVERSKFNPSFPFSFVSFMTELALSAAEGR